MAAMPTMPLPAGQLQRKALLNLKCLFWCIHQLHRQYNVNLAVHSLERGALHPDVANSHLGDNLEYLLETFDEEDIPRLAHALERMSESRSSIDVGEKHFEIGHYVQSVAGFGTIAEGAYGIICSVTPDLRGLFYLEGGHLMESVFAPSDVRVIFGTYVS